jgi:phosphatidylserine/phosphatidylglycerophosphate/cardiolipin synthase-like enzyme
MPIAVGRPVNGRLVFWLCVAFVLGVVASLVVANLGASEKKVDRPLERLHDTRDPAFARDLSVLLGPPLVEGNAAEVLVNGDRIFPAMLKDIRSAKTTISFETYIYWDGTIGDEFAERSPTAPERRQGALCCSTGSAVPGSTRPRSTR